MSSVSGSPPAGDSGDGAAIRRGVTTTDSKADLVSVEMSEGNQTTFSGMKKRQTNNLRYFSYSL